jgi:glycosyltransferase involved in cell wall biosynthesis
MRIIFIQKSTDRGGAKRSLIESLTAMRNDGSVQPCMLVGGAGQFTRDCDAIDIPHLTTPLPEWRKFFDRLKFSGAMKKAAALVADQRPDWIISNEMWWAPHAAAIAKHLGCKSAVILRDGIATIPKAKQYRLFDNDLILPVSSTIGDALKPDPQFRDRVHVLFNSVSVPDSCADQSAGLDAHLAAKPLVKRWLLVVGKVCDRKNQTAAVRMMRLLIDAGHDDVGLLLAGDIDPAYQAEVDRSIAQNRVADRVILLGNFEDIRSLFARSHSVLLPSFREGLPRSLVESIVSGTPAFSYPCEGVGDIYGAYLPEFVSPASIPESLTEVVLNAWKDQGRASEAFAAVRTDVVARFSSASHLAHLKSLLGARPL